MIEQNTKFPEVVTLCGSTKFKDEFLKATKQLTLEGKVVLSVGSFMHADNERITEEQKLMLDELHLRKIDLSNSIFVINPNGYIGDSTRREIRYALNKGKKVEYLE